jgi:hypothetical protein
MAAGADAALWPILMSGLLSGAFALGGIGVGLRETARWDAAQERRETRKRRAEKFEELVAAVYEFNYWVDSIRRQHAFGDDNGPEKVSPFAKVQSISAVYFPQFNKLIGELDRAADRYLGWIYQARQKRIASGSELLSDGFKEAYVPYGQKREALLNALKKFAWEEFQ